MAFEVWSKAKRCLLAAVCFGVVLTPLVRCQSVAISTALHNKDVVELVKTGISTETVVAEIRSAETEFDTSAASLKKLSEANVPEPVIGAMVESSARKGEPASVASLASLPYDEFGHVKIYRPRQIAYLPLFNSIFVDNVGIVNIANGRHCSLRLRPGMHKIQADDNGSPIYLDVQKGKEYYVRVDEVPLPSLVNGYGMLTLLRPEQGSGKYKRQRPVEQDRRLAKGMLDADSEPSVQKSEPKSK